MWAGEKELNISFTKINVKDTYYDVYVTKYVRWLDYNNIEYVHFIIYVVKLYNNKYNCKIIWNNV